MSFRAFIMAAIFVPLVCFADNSHRSVLTLTSDTESQLPDLYSGHDDGNWALDVSASRAELVFANAKEKWDAQLNGDAGKVSAFHLAHAIHLTEKLGTGSRFRHEDGLSDIFVNAIYASTKNLHFRFAASQRRHEASTDMGAVETHSSFLMGLKKIWDKGSWTDAAIRSFVVEARNTSTDSFALTDALTDTDGVNLADSLDEKQVEARMHGIRLDVGMRPFPQARVEFQVELSRTRYHVARHIEDDQHYSKRTIRYLHDIGSCSHLSGGLIDGTDIAEVQLAMSSRNWSLQARHALGGEATTSVMIAYTNSYDGPELEPVPCSSTTTGKPSESVVEALSRQPEQLSYDLLS